MYVVKLSKIISFKNLNILILSLIIKKKTDKTVRFSHHTVDLKSTLRTIQKLANYLLENYENNSEVVRTCTPDIC